MINAQTKPLQITQQKASQLGLPSIYAKSYLEPVNQSQLCGDRLKFFIPYEVWDSDACYPSSLYTTCLTIGVDPS